MKSTKGARYRVRVLENKEIAPGVFVVKFEKTFDFKAGQMLWVKYPDNGASRLYSIASGEREPYFEIIFDKVEGGALTPSLSTVNVGDTLMISEPMGTFMANGPKQIWIATGTGIAPFASMVRTGIDAQIVLIQGGRYPESFYYEEVFKQKSNIQYLKCMSSLQAEGYYHGRVTKYVAKELSADPEAHYMLCGNAEMVVEVRDLLIEKGVHFKNIISEIYF